MTLYLTRMTLCIWLIPGTCPSLLQARFSNQTQPGEGVDRQLPHLFGGGATLGPDTRVDDWVNTSGKQLLKWVHRLVGDSSTDAKAVIEAKNLEKYQDERPIDSLFPCPLNNTRSVAPPTSVHQLRPGDIDVVAAIGDSLTAATGVAAGSLLQVPSSNRGLSWSIGGQGTWRSYLTLPNILKVFNPQLVGYSLGDTLYSEGQQHQQFNLAEPAAITGEALVMAKRLVEKMRADQRIQFSTSWKMVTIMLGAVDLCFDVCYLNDPLGAPKKHRRYLEEALDYLMEFSPRTLVNLAIVPDIPASIMDITGMPGYCVLLYKILCPCVTGPTFAVIQKEYQSLTRLVQAAQMSLADEEKYQKKDDFTVVLQPFFFTTRYPKTKNNRTDFRYLAPDCFHASQRGQAMAANALWNNLLEPVGRKSTSWEEPFKRFLCPTSDHPYIYTNINGLTKLG